jgi:four helix bundle protein
MEEPVGRLTKDFLERIESFCDRAVGVSEELGKRKVSLRIVDQALASGTSVGANVFEADEAMSSADFVKCLAIATKELNEFRFWLRLAGRRG